MAQALLNTDNMRTQWRITLDATKILAGAIDKRDWHKGRLDIWEKTRENTKMKLKTNGLVLDESVLDQEHAAYSNSGRAPGVAIDNTLLKDLNEANNKIESHKDKLRAFESWIEFLSAARGEVLELTLSDYLYFFGK